jgi:hypothetical protein
VVNAGTSNPKNLPKDPPLSIENYTFKKYYKYPGGYLIYKRGDSPPKVCTKDYLKQ